MFDWTSFAVPSIPQLHESTLGMHVMGTDIDDGSFHADLVCGSTDKPGDLATVHPSFTFDEPMVSAKVHAENSSTGKVIWDAIYSLGSKKELTRDLVSDSGSQPSWIKICTPPGHTEGYKVSIEGVGAVSGPFNTSVLFSSDNAHVAKVPRDFNTNLPWKPSRQPDMHVTVPIRPDDFNPIKYSNSVFKL